MGHGMKAISPVISIIVLLLIVVTLAGAAWIFLSGYWTSTTGMQIEVVDSFCIGTDQSKIVIKNIGTDTISTGAIMIMDAISGTDITGDVLWSSGVTDPSLVLELKFEEGTGIIAKDTSGKGNDGTLYSAATPCFNGNCPTWVPGKIGGALELGGVNNTVNCGQDKSLNLIDYYITFAGWFKANAYATGFYAGLLHKNMKPRIYLTHPGDRAIHTRLDFDTLPELTCNSPSGRIGLDSWTHFALTYDGNRSRLYLNGSFEAESVEQSGTLEMTTGELVLGWIGWDMNFFNGSIDDFRIYNRALSGEEIKALAENAIILHPGETASMTHTCSGTCNYRLVFGGTSRTTYVIC